jgi:hypothetical protein
MPVRLDLADFGRIERLLHSVLEVRRPVDAPALNAVPGWAGSSP